MPRPNDFIVKAIFLHLGVTVFSAFVLWTGDPGRFELGEAIRAVLALIIGFEFLVYQARYMINDWKGRESDERHSSQDLRGRAPRLDTTLRKNIFIGGGVVRALAGIVLPILLLGGSDGLVVVAISAAAYAFAVVYEWLRTKTVLPSFTDERSSTTLLRESVWVYIVVGASYGLRAGAGVWFGSAQAISISTTIVIGIAFYLVGVMSVLMAWALEGSTGMAWEKSDGELDLHLDGALEGKSHVVALGLLVKPASEAVWRIKTKDRSSRDDRAHLKSLCSPRLPWNAVAIAAATLAGVAGSALTEWPDIFVAETTGLAAIFGCACGYAMTQGRLPLLAGILLTFGLTLLWTQSVRGLLGIGPLVSVIVTYLSIRPLTYRQSINFMTKARGDVRQLITALDSVLKELRR